MKKIRFASLLLTGKVATLPILIGQAKAQVVPLATELLSSDLRVIEMPASNGNGGPGIRLQSIAADSNYTPSNYAAFLCNNGLPTTTTVVVTGLSTGDTVVLAAARNKNDPFHTALDPRLTVGTQGLTVLGTTSIGGGLAGLPGVLTPAKGIASFTITSATLTALAANNRFYLQAAVIPAGAPSVAAWRFSELDEIIVGNCNTNAYGTTLY